MTRKKKKQNTGRFVKWALVFALGVAIACSGKLQSYINWDAIERDAKTLLPAPHITTPATEGLEIPRMASDKQGQIIRRTGYTLSYNAKHKTPQWVAWELTQEETRGTEKRSTEFLSDPDVIGTKAVTYDYSHSGYDRGHMAPAGDMKWSKKAMQESFYMSNICPQNHNLNTGRWNDLEMKSREWARRYGKVHIVCGPIYKGMRNEYIGDHRVKVPDAFFKVILINNERKQAALGFYFENEAGKRPLTDYLVSVDELEQITGFDFFAALPDELENRLEKETIHKLP